MSNVIQHGETVIQLNFNRVYMYSLNIWDQADQWLLLPLGLSLERLHALLSLVFSHVKVDGYVHVKE